MKAKEKNITIIVLISLVVLCSLWLIPNGMPYSHDVEYHTSRILGLTNTIRNGDFLALIHDMLSGYGYANGLFYSNFFFYIPTFLCLLGMSTLNAYKIFTILINIATALTSYFCFKSIIKDNKSTLIATIAYNLSVYRIMSLIVRGACGELLAMIFIPVILLGLYEIIYRDYKKWYLFTIGFVFLLLSHLITSVLMAVFSFIIIVINYKKFFKEKDRIKYLIISGVVGLLLGSFFIFPILEQFVHKSVNIFAVGSKITKLSKFAVGLFDFLLPLPYSVESIHLLNIGYGFIVLLGIPFLFRKEKVKKNDEYSFAKILLIISIVLVIMSTKLFPWNIFETSLSFIQFPWRLLLYSSTFFPISIGIYLSYYYSKKNNKRVKIINGICILGVFILVLTTLAYNFVFAFVCPRKNVFREKIGLGEYLPAGIDVDSSFIGEPDEGKLDLEVYYDSNNEELKYKINRKGKDIKIEYSGNKEGTYLEIPVFNYLGYKAEGAKITDGNYHRMKLLLDNKESGTVHVYYGMTKVQKVSYAISFVSLVGVAIYSGIVIMKKKNK